MIIFIKSFNQYLVVSIFCIVFAKLYVKTMFLQFFTLFQDIAA